MYFINEWDGTRWDRKPLSNGESIVIIDKDGLSYHEWRIINEELIDVADALVIEFNKDFSEVNESIVELSAKTQEIIIFSGFTIDTINEFSGATGEHINNINGRIDLLTNTVSGLSANDLTPGTYVLEGDYSSEMVIPTNSTELPDVKIKVSNDFFNFGEF